MASNYEGFFVSKEDETGAITQIAGVDVEVYDADAETALTTLTTDSNGYIAAGSVSPAAGTRIRFRVENEDGMAGSVTQITT